MLREMMFGTRESFEYFQCRACGCLQIGTVPSDLGSYYPPEYYSFNPKIEPWSEKPVVRRTLEKWRAGNALFGRGYKLARVAGQVVDMPQQVLEIGPLLKRCNIDWFGARFLDVGCGSSSWWLNALRTLGFWRLRGVDPYIEHDVVEDGIPILKRRIEDVSGEFDLVTFHHSLEHIEDQDSTLAAARSVLKPAGFCLVRLPLVSSAAWEEYGTDWVELDPPRHLYLHSRDSMRRVAERAGFDPVDFVSDSTEFEFWGSEQYRRGLPLMAEGSFLRTPWQSDFTFRQMGDFRKRAKELNRIGRGGRGCFFLKAVS
jgi:SAM-dependent methyltransferase